MTDEEHQQGNRRLALECAVLVLCDSKGDPRTVEEIRDGTEDDMVAIRMARQFATFIEEG